MSSNSILSSADSSGEFSARTVLPAHMAVRVSSQHSARRRFADNDWRASQLRRELRDRPTFTESIELEADHAVTRYIDHATKRETSRRVVQFAFAPEPALTIAEEPRPFERVPTLASEAAAALDRMSTRKPKARAVTRPAPAAGRSRVLFATVLVLGALAFAAWLAVRS